MPGAAGSNECPAGSVRIETQAACRAAAAAAGKTPHSFSFVETNSGWPRGCYYNTNSNDAYFNTHAVGAGMSGSHLLCAALASTGAPQTGACQQRHSARVCAYMVVYV